MTTIPKPFPYDAIQTPEAVIFIFEDQGADGRPASKLELGPKGVQIDRADGVIIRMIHLHPQIADAIAKKPIYIIEVGNKKLTSYTPLIDATNLTPFLNGNPSSFYWYIGPETANIHDVALRPFAKLLESIGRLSVAVAPGELSSGPLIGLCAAKTGIIGLARGREWMRASNCLVIDAGLARGTTTGYPADHDIEQAVHFAHEDSTPPPKYRPRGARSPQLAMALTAQ